MARDWRNYGTFGGSDRTVPGSEPQQPANRTEASDITVGKGHVMKRAAHAVGSLLNYGGRIMSTKYKDNDSSTYWRPSLTNK